MTLREFIKTEAPKRCGVHPAFGLIAEWVLDFEALGEPEFSQDKFITYRERASLGLPYKPALGKEDVYEKCIDVLELAILLHYQKWHKANVSKEIAVIEAKQTMTEKDYQVAAADFWNL